MSQVRKYLKFHLSTGIVMMVAAGVLLGSNTAENRKSILFDDSNTNTEERHLTTSGWLSVGTPDHPNRFKCHASVYGWPFVYREEIEFRGGISHFYWKVLGLNLAICIFIVVGCGAMWEVGTKLARPK